MQFYQQENKIRLRLSYKYCHHFARHLTKRPRAYCMECEFENLTKILLKVAFSSHYWCTNIHLPVSPSDSCQHRFIPYNIVISVLTVSAEEESCTKDDEDPGVNCAFKSHALCNYTTEVGTGHIGWQYKSHVTSGQNLPSMDATGNTNGKLFFFRPMYCLSFLDLQLLISPLSVLL